MALSGKKKDVEISHRISTIVDSSSLDWEDAPTEFIPSGGILTEIWGPTGTGRTTLALQAQAPIAYLYFHEKTKGIIEDFAKIKTIKMKKMGGVFTGTPDEIKSVAESSMRYFERFFYDGFGKFKTIIVDTYNEAWMLERLGEFGAPKPEKMDDRKKLNQKRDWAAINNRWMSILNMVRTQDYTNVILIGQAEEEWRENDSGYGSKTGKMVRAGGKAADQVLLKADISLRTNKHTNKKTNNVEFTTTIYKGWGRAQECEGMEFEDDMNKLPTIYSMITGTEEDFWK